MKVNEYYYYKNCYNGDEGVSSHYPYFIYSNADSHSAFATFSKGYFNVLFVDIAEERKLKLEKLNEK